MPHAYSAAFGAKPFAILVGCCVIGIFVLTFQAAASLPPNAELPSAVGRYPRVDEPVVQPGPVFDRCEPWLGLKGRVVQRLDLDSGEPRWSDDLFRVELGYPEPWYPGISYGLFPNGFDAMPNKNCALLSRGLIVFESPLVAGSSKPIRSRNVTKFSIRAVGECLVVEYVDGRRWYFESPDGGAGWRLRKMERAEFPGKAVLLNYTNNRLGELIYPDGSAATVLYPNTSTGVLPDAILMPNGRLTRFQRDRNGYITCVETVIPPLAKGDRETLVQRQRYEYDAKGSILKYRDSWGRVFQVEYEEKKNDDKSVTNTTVMRDTRSGAFRFSRHTSRQNDTDWIVEDGVGSGRETPSSAMVRSQRELQKLDGGYKLVSLSKAGRALETTIKHDSGNASVTRVDPLGRKAISKLDAEQNEVKTVSTDGGVTVREYNPTGRLTREIDEFGEETRYERDEFGRVTRYIAPNGEIAAYAYDGDTIATTIGIRRYTFQLDKLGRLRTALEPGNRLVEWKYNNLGLIESKVVSVLPEEPVPGAQPPLQGVAELFAQLAEVSASATQPSTEATRQTTTQPALLMDTAKLFAQLARESASQVLPKPQTVNYAYDLQGRLTRVLNSDGTFQEFDYAGPRLVSQTRADRSKVSYEYDDWGRLSTVRDSAGRFEAYRYDRLNRIVATTKRTSEGLSLVSREYNELDQIVSETADKGTVRYSYDEAGRRRRALYEDGTDAIFTYDDRDRLIAVRGNHQPAVDYQYDAQGNRTTTTIRPRTSMTPATSPSKATTGAEK